MLCLAAALFFSVCARGGARALGGRGGPAGVFVQGLARPSGLRRVRNVELFPVSGPGCGAAAGGRSGEGYR